MILGAEQLALQIHESVGHAIELDRILGWEAAYAGTSWLDLAQLGSMKYGSELMNITIDPTIPGALGSFGYDDEGTPAAPRDAVREGTWVGVLAGRDSAAVAGLDYAGSVRADGWARLPMVRMTNVGLEPGPHTFDEIIAATDDGIYMETNRSWSIDDRRLNFQFGTEVGYEVKNGQLGRLLRNPTYTGIGPQFWASMDMLSSEIVAWGTPNCGKGQPGQVGHTGHPAAPGPLPQRAGRGAGMTDERDLADAGASSRSRRRCPAPRSRRPADRHRLALTRFANSVIHQNVAEDVTTRQRADPPRRPHGVGVGDRDRRRRPRARWSSGRPTRCRSRRAIPAGRASPPPARAGRRPRPIAAAAGDDARRPGAAWCGLRRRRRRSRDGRLLPHQPLDRGASPTRPVTP